MRCACTLNTFDTMDYGYLNAIRLSRSFRARADGACAGYTDIRYISDNPEFGVAPSCYPRLLFLYRGARSQR
jgi:hypothetical protein